MKLYKIVDGKTTSKIWLLNNFYIYMAKRNKTHNTMVSYMKRLKVFLKNVDMINPTITARQIETFLLNKTGNIHGAIALFLEYAEDMFNVKYNRIKIPKPRRTERKVIEVLSEEQIMEVIKEMPKDLQFLAKFIYFTGCRFSEPIKARVGDLNWAEVSKDKEKYALLTLRDTKGKRERQVPINPQLTKELYEFLKENNRLLKDQFIFDFRTMKYLKRGIRKANKRNIGLGLDMTEKQRREFKIKWIMARYVQTKLVYFDKHFAKTTEKVLGKSYTSHVLRRSRATRLLKAGLPMVAVRDFLGHKDISTTQHYTTISTDELTEYLKTGGL